MKQAVLQGAAAPVRVRAATAADAYALWCWANDPDTRAASFGRAPIPWSTHVQWLAGELVNPGRVALIGELPDSEPIGSIRFDSTDDWLTTRLSYVVAPEARGRRLARLLVCAGVEWMRTMHPGVRIRADVMSDNPRSLALFRRLQWRENVESNAHYFWSER